MLIHSTSLRCGGFKYSIKIIYFVIYLKTDFQGVALYWKIATKGGAVHIEDDDDDDDDLFD